jgi:hypothetical protein
MGRDGVFRWGQARLTWIDAEIVLIGQIHLATSARWPISDMGSAFAGRMEFRGRRIRSA